MSSSSELESASELMKLFYAAHLTSKESERALMMEDGAFSSSGEGFSKQDLLQITCVKDVICFPKKTRQSKSEQVNIARSTADDYLRDPTKKLPKTNTTYSSIKANVNRIFSPEFPYFTFEAPFDHRKGKTFGAWDFENCPVPDTFTKDNDYKNVIPNIQNGIKKWGFKGSLKVVGVGDTRFLNGATYLQQESTLELFHEVKIGREEDTSDKRLIVEMRAKMEEHLLAYNEPGNILLMTGDIDFLGVISEAKKMGFYVILAYNEKNWVSPELKSAADRVVPWFKLVEGKV